MGSEPFSLLVSSALQVHRAGSGLWLASAIETKWDVMQNLNEPLFASINTVFALLII